MGLQQPAADRYAHWCSIGGAVPFSQYGPSQHSRAGTIPDWGNNNSLVHLTALGASATNISGAPTLVLYVLDASGMLPWLAHTATWDGLNNKPLLLPAMRQAIHYQHSVHAHGGLPHMGGWQWPGHCTQLLACKAQARHCLLVNLMYTCPQEPCHLGGAAGRQLATSFPICSSSGWKTCNSQVRPCPWQQATYC